MQKLIIDHVVLPSAVSDGCLGNCVHLALFQEYRVSQGRLYLCKVLVYMGKAPHRDYHSICFKKATVKQNLRS